MVSEKILRWRQPDGAGADTIDRYGEQVAAIVERLSAI